MTNKNHPFHLVDVRPWPILGSLGALVSISGIIKWFHLYNTDLFFIGTTILSLVVIQWWRDVSREATFQGHHTFVVTIGLRWGIILFITSEVFFFISFFWGFFHNRLAPAVEIGITWPPKGIFTFNPIQIPLLNTLILLTSGLTVTWAHHSLIENNFKQATQGLGLTIVLGIYFSILQGYEYFESPFSISDAVYGSSFFMATGFHGIHVIIGTTFLTVCLIRHLKNHFSQIHHFGFEAAAWYWHFVDVVWLFLYISIYWWGRYLYSIKIIFDFQSKDLENSINNFNLNYPCNHNPFNLHFTCSSSKPYIKKNFYRPRKKIPIWMWIWSKIICTSPVLSSLLPNCNYLLNLWCWNHSTFPSNYFYKI